MKVTLKKTIVMILTAVLILSSSWMVFAETDEPEVEQYTLEELQEAAINYSRELRRLGQVLDRSEIMRREAALQKTFTPVGGGTTFEEFAASQAILGLLSADVQIELNQKKIETEEEKIVYDVMTTWYDIQSTMRNLDLAQFNYELAEKELIVANLQNNLGMINQFQHMQAKDAFAEAEINIQKETLSLQEAFETMNALTGKNADERYQLVEASEDMDVVLDDSTKMMVEEEEVLEVKIYEQPNLERNINRVLSRHPDLWALEKQVELAEWGLRLYTYNQGQAPYDAQEIDVQTAKLSLSSAKQQVENMVRNLAISLKQMENERVTLEINLKQAEENVKLAKLRLEVGMAVPLEVMRAEKVAMQLENGLNEMDAQYENLLVLFEKPWVSSGMPGQ